MPISAAEVADEVITPSDLEQIRTRLRKASAGPWVVRRMRNHWPSHVGDRHTHPCVRAFRVPKRVYELAPEQCEGDAAFMAGTRQDVPALLAEVDRLLATLHEVRRALRELSMPGRRDLALDVERVVVRISQLQL
jgi:hypothetical protein